MRTRDHEHGHDSLDGERGVAGSQCEPRDERDQTGTDCDERQDESGAVREILSTRARCLRLLHQPHDASHDGTLTDAGDLDPQ